MVEIAAVLELRKALVFSSGRVQGASAGATQVAVALGAGSVNMLVNCSYLVNVESADAAVSAGTLVASHEPHMFAVLRLP